MCLGIPGKVVETYHEHDTLMGRVEFGKIYKRVCLAHVPDIRVDDYVLVHVGFAITRIDEAAAKEVLATLQTLELADPVLEADSNAPR